MTALPLFLYSIPALVIIGARVFWQKGIGNEHNVKTAISLYISSGTYIAVVKAILEGFENHTGDFDTPDCHARLLQNNGPYYRLVPLTIV